MDVIGESKEQEAESTGLTCYLRRSFLGRTTQRANSPTKAPAATMAIIWAFLRIRYAHSIRSGCYTPFTWMLNLCYRPCRSPLPGKTDTPRFWLARSERSSGFGCPLPALRAARWGLLAEEFLGENHPEGEQSDKGSGGYYGYHSGRSSEFVVTIVSPQVVTPFLHGC